MKALFIFFAFQVLLNAQNCPNGYFYQNNLGVCLMYATMNGSGYTTDWTNAYLFCDQQQGTLVSIHNAFQNNLFVDLQKNVTGFDAEFWLGAYRKDGTWSWSDETQMDYQQFQGPNASGDFATLNSANRTWNRQQITPARNFFCVASVLPTPSQSPLPCLPAKQQPLYNCRQGWQYSSDTGYQYLVIFDKKFIDGEAACQSQGAHLVSIHSKQENDFVTGLCCESGCNEFAHDYSTLGWYLTGGTKKSGSVFEWTDGTPYDYENKGCNLGSSGQHINIYNYGLDCKNGDCGRGIWGFKISDSYIAPYLVCKKK